MRELVFRGRLRPGADRARVIAALARMFRRSPAEIERRLFGQGETRIATVETAAEARRYVEAFARAGAILELRPRRAAEPAQPPAPPGPPPGPRRRRVWILGAVASLALLATAAGWYLLPLWSSAERSQAEVGAARALADKDMLLLGQLDVARAAALERRFFGAPDPGALLDADAGADDLVTSLQAAGIDPRASLDDILFAAYVGESGFDTAFVLLGRFEPRRIRDWLASRYRIEESFPSTNTLHFGGPAGAACVPDELLAARLARDRILVASPKRLPVLARRLQGEAEAGVPLQRWRALGDAQIATLGLFGPDRLGAAGEGVGGALLAAAGEHHRSASAAYLGVAPALLPPGIVLEGEVVSDDREYLRSGAESARAFLRDSLAEARSDWPELVPLYERVEVAQEGHALRGSLRLDTQFDEELGRLFTAVMSDLFSFDRDESGRRAEAIDEDPRRYADVDDEAVEPFDHWGDAAATAWQDGPFAARVKSVELDAEGREVVELAIEGRGLPNLGSMASGVRVRVEEVLDADGNSLLPAHECGDEDPRAWQASARTGAGSTFRDGELVRYSRVRDSLELRLREGARAAAIAAIRGRIEHRLPTRVARERLEKPLAGRVVESGGLRLRFRSAGEQQLAYHYSGETDRLLAVRALNGSGQVLQQHGSLRGEQFLGRGRHATVEYRGDIAAAEVIIAGARETRLHAFELDSGLPTLGDVSRGPPPAPAVAAPGRLARNMALPPPDVEFEYNPPLQTLTTGPLLIAVDRLQQSKAMGLWGGISVYVPNELPLAHQMHGAAVHLDAAVAPDGGRVSVDHVDYLALEPDGAYWRNGEYTLREERPWLTGSSSLQLPDYEGQRPRALEGRVSLHAATATDTLAVPARIGGVARGDALDLAVTGWSGGSIGTIEVQVDGPARRLVGATAHDGEGRRVDTGVSLRASGDAATLSVRVSRWPETLRVRHALAREEQELPFRIELSE